MIRLGGHNGPRNRRYMRSGNHTFAHRSLLTNHQEILCYSNTPRYVGSPTRLRSSEEATDGWTPRSRWFSVDREIDPPLRSPLNFKILSFAFWRALRDFYGVL